VERSDEGVRDVRHETLEAGSQETMKEGLSDPLTDRIIGVAIGVHRDLGPGFLESIYEEAMAIAMRDADLRFLRQPAMPVLFRGRTVGEHRLDFLVEDAVVLELKAVKSFEDVHFAIVRSYLRATSKSCGLLMNFAAPTLQVKRIGPDFRPHA
jgi:GxxExxY protein